MKSPRFPLVPPARFTLPLLLLLLLLAAPGLRAGSVADLDQQNGLPDAQIGTPVTAFKGLQLTEDTGRWTSYRRPADRMLFDRFELSSITYNFFKGKLYSIFLDVEGKQNVRGVLAALQNLYGRSQTYQKQPLALTRLSMETREWTGQKIYLLFKNSDDLKGGQITYLDRPTWDALQVPKQQRTAELRKMLEGSFTNGDF